MKMLKVTIASFAVMLMTAFTPPTNSDKTKGFDFENVKQSGKVGLEIGDTAPDLAFEGPDGKIYKLSALKGKVVLIDFWASWCMPCRRENPNVVSAYEKYSKAKFKNAKGFDIYSVSLDKSKDKWVEAIAQDNLIWKNHVSDLGGWASKPAEVFAVRSIPYSILIDQNGVILAKNLRGKDLHLALDELIKSL
jgi:thiol-disulfide isomerase/thioredoxin